jgi:hypothetical protein
MFLISLQDSRQILGKIRPGQFEGQNSGYNADINSREKINKSEMVCDSDLQTLPVANMVFRDIFIRYQTHLLRPPPLLYL